MSDLLLNIPPRDPDFDQWWAPNHPWDWWAKERKEGPLPHFDRLLVSSIAREAWDAGKRRYDIVQPKEKP